MHVPGRCARWMRSTPSCSWPRSWSGWTIPGWLEARSSSRTSLQPTRDGPKGTGERSLARNLYPRLEEDWLLIADRNFYSYQDWRDAVGTGAQLLWRVKSDLRLPVLDILPDGSHRSVLVDPDIRGKARDALIELPPPGKTSTPMSRWRCGWWNTTSPTETWTATTT